MIKQFKDEHRWLSNFWGFDCALKYPDGKGGYFYFKTNEHFYVAMKTLDYNKRAYCQSCDKVKSYGKTFDLREDWNDIKLDVMLYGLRYKFSNANPSLKAKLINTEDEVIQEGNYWNDKFWGVCLKTGEGENNLGKLIMEVREEIRGG